MNNRCNSSNGEDQDLQRSLLDVITSNLCIKIIDELTVCEHTVTTLSNTLQISKSSICYHLRHLERAGIIEIIQSIDDLRLKKISLSNRGRSLYFLYENNIIFHPMVTEK